MTIYGIGDEMHGGFKDKVATHYGNWCEQVYLCMILSLQNLACNRREGWAMSS